MANVHDFQRLRHYIFLSKTYVLAAANPFQFVLSYCLRLREAGKRIVFTPHAKLLHAESASRGKDNRADRRDRFEHELNLLRARWGDVLNDDPAYNPQLSRDGVPYNGLAWPPGRRTPRYNRPPTARDLPLGF